MNAVLENLGSKKLVASTSIIGFLLTLAIQQPEKAMACAYLAVGYNTFYSLLEVVDKWLNKEKPNGKPVEPT
ncbi:MAG: hypothetical protein IMZ53_10125 [Thermoplasmata archaeon]|nr:hypothetical protein [Thermoplasmata archaeon]